MKIEGISTTELMGVLGHQGEVVLKNSTFSPNEVRAELGYRFALPFLMIIAVLLATPLATVRPRQGRWLKLIPALFIFVANVLILISLKESISKGKTGVFVYPVAVALFAGFALYLNHHDQMMAKIRLKRHQNEQEVT